MGRNLKVFFTILIFVAETCEALDCTKPEGPEATKCLEIFDELGEAANGLDISNKTRTTKMLENCEKFSRCRHTLGCRTDGLFVGVANAALMFCEYSFRVHEELESLPDRIPDKVKMAEIRKESCDNIFGKDNCIEKEIRETCGAEMWRGFREVSLEFEMSN
eukprot:NP_494577.1 Uncharacterized protein CELE_W10G11.4 [Caenorhabditis elegans]